MTGGIADGPKLLVLLFQYGPADQSANKIFNVTLHPLALTSLSLQSKLLPSTLIINFTLPCIQLTALDDLTAARLLALTTNYISEL